MGTATANLPRYAISNIDGVEVYKVGAECVIMLQPSSGFVSVQCPWHPELNGCHYWSARGAKTLKQFLVSLNKDYALGKLFNGNALTEFDREKSQAKAMATIIDLRRNRDIDAERARDLYEDVKNCQTPDDIARLDFDEPWYCIVNIEKSSVAWFWDEVWAAFANHLRTELTGA
mgnify:CR=1 FL=1